MPEPDPMGWEEACNIESWWAENKDRPYDDLVRKAYQKSCRAIAIARQEKERAEAIGVTVKVQGPDALGKFAASFEEVPGALGYGDTPHEAEISARRAIIPVLTAKIKREKERADKIHGAYCEVLDESLRPQKAADLLARLTLAEQQAEKWYLDSIQASERASDWALKAAKLSYSLYIADKFAVEVGRLPLTRGPVVDALRAYLEYTIQAPPPDTIPESKEETS